jgi:thiosulfate/3-mercaptopyruvate sulfurtransferase
MTETTEAEDRSYAHPEVLVSTQWVEDHLLSGGVRVVESNEDPVVYPSGHLQGGVEIDWIRDLNDPIRRDYIDSSSFSALLSRMGIAPDTTVVFYGDKNNWWAAYTFWVFQLFGHTKAKLMDGGRRKWEQEGRKLTREIPEVSPTTFPQVTRRDSPVRAFRQEVLEHLGRGGALVDVRSPEEFNGTRMHMADYPNEGSLRGGHIPGAINVPWDRAVREDGTFKSATELHDIYVGDQGALREEEVVTYCRIGERSSHTWFVLTYLLGFERVRNYDGSWTEWGNLVGVPVDR